MENLQRYKLSGVNEYAVTTGILAVLGSSFIAYRLIGYLVSKFLRGLTLLPELDLLNSPRPSNQKIKGTVVIAGASFAGLWTACVCSDHFEDVIIIEPDAWVCTEEGTKTPVKLPVTKRARVAQYNSLHGFQTFALLALRKFFPSWDEQLNSEGALIVAADMPWHYAGVPFVPKSGSHTEGMLISRPLYETLLRRNVRNRCKNVRFIPGIVLGVKPAENDRGKIGSVHVKIKREDGEPDEEKSIETVLFVDCAGPTHNGLKWLSSAGYGTQMLPLKSAKAPASTSSLTHLLTSYRPKLGYSSSIWPGTQSQWDRVAAIIPSVPGTVWAGYDPKKAPWIYAGVPDSDLDYRNAAIGWLEGNQFLILCGGWGDFHLTRTPEEIIEYFRDIKGLSPIPEWIFKVLDIIFESKEEATYENLRVPTCSRVSYSKADSLPSNFIAVGDSTMRLNPIFGQGTSKALMGAIILNASLRQLSSTWTEKSTLSSDFASRFFTEYDRRVAEPLWNETRLRDYGFNSTVLAPGESQEQGKVIRWFEKKLMMTCTWDAETNKVLNDIRQFLAPPALVFFTPTVLMKVFWETITGKSLKIVAGRALV